MNTLKAYQITTKFALAVLSMMLVVGLYSPLSAETHILSNGLKVNVYTPEDLQQWITEEDGSLMMEHPDGGSLEMLSGPEDPRFPRTDVNQFVPISESHVIAALTCLQTIAPEVTVDLFLLPSPPVMTMGSFSRRNAIFLSPGFDIVPLESVAWVTLHELGHVLTWAYFDQRPERWESYMELRRLNEDENNSSAPHANRAREILAEDIRFLFGGPLANTSGGIENRSILLPNQVIGLEDMLVEYLNGNPMAPTVAVCSAFPNPCNPQTTVEMQISEHTTPADPASAVLEIFNIRGERVKMTRGGQYRNNRIAISWTGIDDNGQSCSSGKYFYRLTWSGVVGSGSIALIK
ncbi:MAG: hypothetical protein GY893_05245 [bacterium]|nr:hypothetical protein [bacterium]